MKARKKRCKNSTHYRMVSIDQFSKHPTNVDGLRSICKACEAERQRAYYMTKLNRSEPPEGFINWNEDAIYC